MAAHLADRVDVWDRWCGTGQSVSTPPRCADRRGRPRGPVRRAGARRRRRRPRPRRCSVPSLSVTRTSRRRRTRAAAGSSATGWMLRCRRRCAPRCRARAIMPAQQRAAGLVELERPSGAAHLDDVGRQAEQGAARWRPRGRAGRRRSPRRPAASASAAARSAPARMRVEVVEGAVDEAAAAGRGRAPAARTA